MAGTTPKLSVAVRAYNQETEVIRALDSVVKQHFDDGIELVVGVDVSIDNTLSVVQEYCTRLPDNYQYHIIEHKARQGGTRNLIATLKACNGEYVAILDADDYWIDKEKTRKQASILDASPEIGLVYGDFIIESINLGNDYQVVLRPEPEENIFTQLLKGNFLGTHVSMFRRSLLSFVDFDYLQEKGWSQDDYYLWLEFANHTKFYHLNDKLAVYRIDRDANAPNIPYDACAYDSVTTEVREHYIRKYPFNTSMTIPDVWDAHYRMQFRAARLVKDHKYAVNAIDSMSNQKGLPLLYKLCRNRFFWSFYVRRFHKTHRTDNLSRYFL